MKRLLTILFFAAVAPSAASASALTLTPPEDLSGAAPAVLVSSTAAVERMVRQPAALPLAPAPATTVSWLASLQPPTKPKGLSLLGQMVDYTEADQATFRSEVLRVMVPARTIQPFAAVAREHEKDDDLDDKSRLGFGAGTRWVINRAMNFGTEVLVFPTDHTTELENTLSRFGDVRVLTRLQIKF